MRFYWFFLGSLKQKITFNLNPESNSASYRTLIIKCDCKLKNEYDQTIYKIWIYCSILTILAYSCEKAGITPWISFPIFKWHICLLLIAIYRCKQLLWFGTLG